MTRLLLLFAFVATTLATRASDVIPLPKTGVSASVTQPHVTAELISETLHPMPGRPFLVALHLHMDPGWHTYWINPGDAGLATKIEWTLPPGFTAGPIQWPTPEIHAMGDETTFGYAGDVYLLTTITASASAEPSSASIKAHAEWLVCQEECIPGKADLSLELDLSSAKHPGGPMADTLAFFKAARERLPVPNTQWNVESRYDIKPGLGQPGQQALWIQFKNKAGLPPLAPGHLYFFPEQGNVLAANESDNGPPDPATKISEFTWALTLQQNGDKPPQISGVLVSDQPLIGKARSVYLPAFATDAKDVQVISASLSNRPAPMADTTATKSSPEAARTPAAPIAGPAQVESAQPWLIAVLGAAFLGGLILNLMPCVLPVLSLKVFSLVRHAGEHPEKAWRQGAAFTAGVVISFWVLAGLLIALQTEGRHLGWGFQMQSPGFVLALIFLFFLLALNLFGVFEVGTSLVGLDAKAAGRAGGFGLTGSFLNGALATVAATPCTAPFMGSSIGFAAEQPPVVALLIFTFLALGMAMPYLLLTIFPGALRFVPKPGAWMDGFKQFMGFLLLATVIFLVYVFGALVRQDQIPYLLAVLLLAGIAAWIYGRWGGAGRPARVRIIGLLLTLWLLGFAIHWGISLARATPGAAAEAEEKWQPWTPLAVDVALAQGRPVFVDFTAAWCLSCKVNEQVALESAPVRQAFAKKNVALFQADWTHQDPAISEVLARYHRDGVPLYLLYSPKAKTAPQVLPPLLTPGIVLDALGKD